MTVPTFEVYGPWLGMAVCCYLLITIINTLLHQWVKSRDAESKALYDQLRMHREEFRDGMRAILAEVRRQHDTLIAALKPRERIPTSEQGIRLP